MNTPFFAMQKVVLFAIKILYIKKTGADMKKITILLALLLSLAAISFLAVSCSKPSEPVLRIGTEASYPPFEFKDEKTGEFKGIDMDLARLIAKKLNMKLEIMDMEFDALIPSLGANKIDMLMAAMTITDERKQQVDFSDSYFAANQSLIIPNESKVLIDSLPMIATMRIGAQNGTTGQLYIDSNFVKAGKMPKENLKKYATNIEAITDLINGNLDVVIIDDEVGKSYAKIKPVKTIFTISTGENYGIAFQKNSPLKDKVNAAMIEVLNSEEWQQILQTYWK